MSSGPAHPGVLVGVDGSPSSRAAARWAAHEATVRNVPLTPVHVVCTPAVSSSALSWPAVPIPAELRQRPEDEAAKVMADAIKLVEDSATEGARPEIKSELFFSAPVPTLVDLSKETQMVGCRGRGALRRDLLGSVSTGLIHHAHCPVAVIHDKVPSSPCWLGLTARRHRIEQYVLCPVLRQRPVLDAKYPGLTAHRFRWPDLAVVRDQLGNPGAGDFILLARGFRGPNFTSS